MHMCTCLLEYIPGNFVIMFQLFIKIYHPNLVTRRHFLISQCWLGGSSASWYELWGWDDFSHLETQLGGLATWCMWLLGLPHSMAAGFWERAFWGRGRFQASLFLSQERRCTHRQTQLFRAFFRDWWPRCIYHYYLLWNICLCLWFVCLF